MKEFILNKPEKTERENERGGNEYKKEDIL